tara:strand:+ start:381 stop:740 length:360 start_codon:yes stop_codon:yes gene_type:complete
MEEMTKTEQGRERRRKEAEQRAADRESRWQRANKRQRDADVATYGEGSMLLESKRGNIYDVETGAYDPAFNKEGTDETIGNDGIDQVDDGDISTETFTLDVVKSNNAAGTATFNGSGVN